MNLPVLQVRKRKIANIFNGEPWVYSNAIIEGPKECCLVQIQIEDKSVIAYADFNPDAPVPARVLTRKEWPGDEEFIARQMETAFARRLMLGYTPQGGSFRLINSEGDGLPGLVIDWFGKHIIIEINTVGMYHRLEYIKYFFAQQFSDSQIHVHVSKETAKREGIEQIEQDKATVSFAENGVLFQFDLDESQKTGSYIDQRENRRIIALAASDKRVLDCFCYHGGFGLSAMAGGATGVTCVDSSQKAIEAVEANAALNGFMVETICDDAFDWLQKSADEIAQIAKQTGGFASQEAQSMMYDLIICDPPKLAPGKKDKRRGLSAYRFLIDKCLRLLAPHGFFMVSSCSSAIELEDMRKLIVQTCSKRNLDCDVIASTGQTADHPWPVSFPAGHYLSTYFVHTRPQI